MMNYYPQQPDQSLNYSDRNVYGHQPDPSLNYSDRNAYGHQPDQSLNYSDRNAYGHLAPTDLNRDARPTAKHRGCAYTLRSWLPEFLCCFFGILALIGQTAAPLGVRAS